MVFAANWPRRGRIHYQYKNLLYFHDKLSNGVVDFGNLNCLIFDLFSILSFANIEIMMY